MVKWILKLDPVHNSMVAFSRLNVCAIGMLKVNSSILFYSIYISE